LKSETKDEEQSVEQEVTQQEEQNDAQTVDPLTQAQEEAAEWKDKYLRAHADFENTKKRLERDKYTAISYANESFSKDILAVMDSFDQALLAIESADNESSSEIIEKMKEGINLTYGQLKKILEKNSITEIGNEGQFDPNCHQVIMQVDSDDHESGDIVQVMQKGYMIKDRVLRPSMVSTKK